ncbi:hypothetical protein HN873_016413 [Arachis hypogaea]
MMTRKRKSLSNSAPNDAAAPAAAPDTTTNDGEKATSAPVITPEFRLANHLLLSKKSGGYKNVAFSPLCIKLLLSIVAAGPFVKNSSRSSDQNPSTISTPWQLSSCPPCLSTLLRAADLSSLTRMVFGLTKGYL